MAITWRCSPWLISGRPYLARPSPVVIPAERSESRDPGAKNSARPVQPLGPGYSPAANSGMTGRVGARLRDDKDGGYGAAYPRCSGLWHHALHRCLRRDVAGPIHRPRGSGRRPEGERVARDPGGPDAPVSGEAPAMARSRRPPFAAQGAMASSRNGAGRKPKQCTGTRNRRRGCRKATPGP